MDEKTLNNLTQLEQLFQHTCQVCDPLDYAIRQRNLVYTLTNFLLIPLVEYREEQKKIAAEAAQAVATINGELPVTDEANHEMESV